MAANARSSHALNDMLRIQRREPRHGINSLKKLTRSARVVLENSFTASASVDGHNQGNISLIAPFSKPRNSLLLLQMLVPFEEHPQ